MRRGNTFMSHGTGDQDPEVGTPERGPRPTVARNEYGGCCDDALARTRYLPPTSISLFGTSSGNWPCGAGCRTYNTSDLQSPWRRYTAITRLFCRQQFDIERDCDARAQGFLIHRASTQQAWLTSIAAKFAVFSLSIILIVCSWSNCSKLTSCWFLIACALSPRNHRN